MSVGLEGHMPGLSAESLMMVAHVAMIGGMAVPMLYRWDTYTNGHCHAPGAAAPVRGGIAPAADSVCGMPADPATARHTAEYEGKTYAFCAPGCKKAFQRHRASFLAPGRGTFAFAVDLSLTRGNLGGNRGASNSLETGRSGRAHGDGRSRKEAHDGLRN